MLGLGAGVAEIGVERMRFRAQDVRTQEDFRHAGRARPLLGRGDQFPPDTGASSGDIDDQGDDLDALAEFQRDPAFQRDQSHEVAISFCGHQHRMYRRIEQTLQAPGEYLDRGGITELRGEPRDFRGVGSACSDATLRSFGITGDVSGPSDEELSSRTTEVAGDVADHRVAIGEAVQGRLHGLADA